MATDARITASAPTRLSVSAEHRAAVDTFRKLDDAMLDERKRMNALRERHRDAEQRLWSFMQVVGTRTLISDGSSIAAQTVRSYSSITPSLVAAACEAENVDQRVIGRLLHRIQNSRTATERHKISRIFYDHRR